MISESEASGNRDRRALLEQLFHAGVASCQPRTVLPDALPVDAPRGRNIVLGAGKAAAEMAAVAAERLAGDTVGLVVTRYGHGARSSTGRIEVIEAGHPVPDDASVDAAEAMLSMAEHAEDGDRVLFLFSGGGSALLCAPVDGVSVGKKQEITRFLLHSGARIDEINLVRKHLSRIKGGGLAARVAHAELLTYVISDVVGDDPGDVASGPSVPMVANVPAAADVLEKYDYPDSAAVAEAMAAAVKPAARQHPLHVVATARMALEAMAASAQEAGFEPVILGDDLDGDAAATGREHAKLALRYRGQGKPVTLISGGELTVTVKNADGRGGRNLEYLASLMIHLDGAPGIEAIACDSDGIDGTENNAGACIGPDSLARIRSKGLDPEALLATNDCWTCFDALGDLVVTGPTRTNVNDLRVILVDPDYGPTSD